MISLSGAPCRVCQGRPIASLSISAFETSALRSQVRGANYLNDKKKVEAEGLEAELLNVDLVELEEKFWNIAEVLPAVTNSTAPFMFIMQARCWFLRGLKQPCDAGRNGLWEATVGRQDAFGVCCDAFHLRRVGQSSGLCMKCSASVAAFEPLSNACCELCSGQRANPAR